MLTAAAGSEQKGEDFKCSSCGSCRILSISYLRCDMMTLLFSKQCILPSFRSKGRKLQLCGQGRGETPNQGPPKNGVQSFDAKNAPPEQLAGVLVGQCAGRRPDNSARCASAACVLRPALSESRASGHSVRLGSPAPSGQQKSPCVVHEARVGWPPDSEDC